METECCLCRIVNSPKEGENIYYEDKKFMVLDTKDKKGHNKRIMIISKEHRKYSKNFRRGIDILKMVSMYIFKSLGRYLILGDDFSQAIGHWHMISCSDELGTDWKKIRLTEKELVKLG